MLCQRMTIKSIFITFYNERHEDSSHHNQADT